MLFTMARLVTAALLIASAAVFATGAVLEHHAAGGESRPAQQHETGTRPGATGEHARTTESDSGHSDSGQPEAGRDGSARPAAEHHSETLLGINPEATGLVAAAVALSLLLAALILTVGSPLLAISVALVMLAYTALDIRELTHQLNESHAGIGALAATVAVLHLAAGAAALRTARHTRRHSGAAIAG